MTDKEKAEKYATENLPDGYTKVNYEKKEAYLAGFADGRKESLEENQKLKVENKELKSQIEKMMGTLEALDWIEKRLKEK